MTVATKRRLAISFGVACLASSLTRVALASDALEFPDNGTEPLGRGGAWVARASNPLATFYNPAGLAGQRSGVLLDVHLVFSKVCFDRAGPGEQLNLGGGLDYPKICNDNTGPQPLPSLAAVFRATDKLGIGLSVMPPSLYGALKFPETQRMRNTFGADVQLPTAQRYMLIEQGGIALNITLGAGLEVTRGLRVGAGFVWGLASYDLANANMSVKPVPDVNGVYRDPVEQDVRAELKVADWFMPGVVIGGLWSVLPELDVGASFFAQEAFDAHGDLGMKANYWTNNGTSDSADVSNSKDVEKGLGHFRLAHPFQAKLGGRFHLPRHADRPAPVVRDPLVDDVFDVELDLQYAHNSAYKRADLRFPNTPVVSVVGTPGRVPENNDVDIHAKDTIGVRVGGDYVVLPGQLGVRAGGWFEPRAQDEAYASVAFNATQRIGLAAGAVYRIGPIDVEAGYMHVFFSTVDNGGNGKVLVVSGDASSLPVPYRSPYPINGGKITQSANIVSVGGTARF